MIELDTIYNEDCLVGMQRIPDGSVDCVICDLPYGTIACKWDSVIPFEPLWEQYHRICTRNAPIILFGSEPFSTMLRASNINEYRYDWIWVKTKAGNFQICKVQPLKLHETISVFYRKMPTYNNTELQPCHVKNGRTHKGKNVTVIKGDPDYIQTEKGYNKSVLYYGNPSGAGHLHPTQKPVDLISYLVRTYTNEGDTVLDNCIGSGTTAIACIREKRHFLGFELNKEYFDIAQKRILQEISEPKLF